MISIKKTGEGYYLISIIKGNNSELGRVECHLIKREITPLIKNHREISIDIKGFNKINESGLKILRQLSILTENHKCRIRYINVDPLIYSKIADLSGRKLTKAQSDSESLR